MGLGQFALRIELIVNLNKIIKEKKDGQRTLEKAILTSTMLTVVRMWGNEDTYVLIVRGM